MLEESAVEKHLNGFESNFTYALIAQIFIESNISPASSIGRA